MNLGQDSDEEKNSDIDESSVFCNTAEKSVQLVGISNNNKRKTRNRNGKIKESAHEKANEMCKQHWLVRINVPPLGDFLPQACMVVYFNCKQNLNQEE